jgi:hypothetical protein
LKEALINTKDSKLQFNSLILLDQVFQTLFLGPETHDEIANWENTIKIWFENYNKMNGGKT